LSNYQKSIVVKVLNVYFDALKILTINEQIVSFSLSFIGYLLVFLVAANFYAFISSVNRHILVILLFIDLVAINSVYVALLSSVVTGSVAGLSLAMVFLVCSACDLAVGLGLFVLLYAFNNDIYLYQVRTDKEALFILNPAINLKPKPTDILRYWFGAETGAQREERLELEKEFHETATVITSIFIVLYLDQLLGMVYRDVFITSLAIREVCLQSPVLNELNIVWYSEYYGVEVAIGGLGNPEDAWRIAKDLLWVNLYEKEGLTVATAVLEVVDYVLRLILALQTYTSNDATELFPHFTLSSAKHYTDPEVITRVLETALITDYNAELYRNEYAAIQKAVSQYDSIITAHQYPYISWIGFAKRDYYQAYIFLYLCYIVLCTQDAFWETVLVFEEFEKVFILINA
jgi:NADH:ubiquinone oxidoreductase subunit K